jgi:exodeoxyribonuclease-3
MKLVSWNVNGVRAVHKRGDLAWAFQDADVVCIQETKAAPEQVPEDLRAPEGWQASWVLGEKKGYSGVATFVRDGIEAREIGSGFGKDPRFDNEGRVLVHDLGAFVLLNIYFPNGGRGPDRLQYKLDFYEAFHEYVLELLEDGRDVVVCGDVNTAHRDIDVAKPEEWANESSCLPEERAFLDRLLESGFIDTYRAEAGDRPNVYTWWDVRKDAREINEGQRIDYFFINEGLEDLLVDAWVNPNISGSDHCPIGLELELDLEV